MAKLTKEIAIDTSKEVLRRALLPNSLLAVLLIFLHWVIISLWLAFNYENQSWITNLIIIAVGGSSTVFTYFMWGLRRFLIKAYLIIHYNIINLWLHPFCKGIADKVLNGNLLEELKVEESSILHQWYTYVIDKSKDLPKFIQWIIRAVLRKVGYSDDLAHKIKLIVNKDTDEISHLISDEISYRLIAASNRLVPAQIIYLIPINIILIIILWVVF